MCFKPLIRLEKKQEHSASACSLRGRCRPPLLRQRPAGLAPDPRRVRPANRGGPVLRPRRGRAAATLAREQVVRAPLPSAANWLSRGREAVRPSGGPGGLLVGALMLLLLLPLLLRPALRVGGSGSGGGGS